MRNILANWRRLTTALLRLLQKFKGSSGRPDGESSRFLEDNLPPFKAYVRRYLDGYSSRRKFVAQLTGLGLGLSGASRLSFALAEPKPLEDVDTDPGPAGATELMSGRGGDIFVGQLRRCGVRFIFNNPSTGTSPIFDALMDYDDMHVITCPHEGPLTAMANGYGKASRTVPFMSVARLGFPNTLVNMFNAFRDRTPMIVGTDQVPETHRGGFAQQEVDDLLKVAEPYSRWRWETRRADSIATDIRRAFKFALTPPYGPVFLSVPTDHLSEHTNAELIDLSRFTLTNEIRADKALVEEAARMLLRAEHPILHVGDDIYRTNGEQAAVELAETASLAVVDSHTSWRWTSNFPTDHPLYLGYYHRSRFGEMRHPPEADLVINLGGALPVPGALPRGAELIDVRSDIESIGRVYPGKLQIPGNVRLFAEELTKEIRRISPPATLRTWREGRGRATAGISRKLSESLELVAKEHWNDAPLSVERVGKQLSDSLDRDAVIVAELDGARPAARYFTFGQDRMTYFSSSGTALGWAVGAAAGVKLAMPTRQVVAMTGDGAFLFGGDQALWSMRRYRIPVIVVVFNNQSYDNERRRIWGRPGSRQAAEGKDMTCYLGDPDVDYGMLARAYDIEAAKVTEGEQLGPAIARAVEATREGRPFLLDVHVARRGFGKSESWYPQYFVAG